MAISVENFISKPQESRGLYQAANQLESNRVRDAEMQQRQDVRKNATAVALSNYLDPKDHLTGTVYDPQIVDELQQAMQEGSALAAKGADTATIMMALGPKVRKISQYSTKAKLLNQQVADSINRLKPYKGYNVEALKQKALKNAFYDAEGKLKDISTVDADQDWVGYTLENNPEEVTSWAGLDDFVDKTPMAEYTRGVKTLGEMGKSSMFKYTAKHPFWEDLEMDEKGNPVLDPSTGKPKGLSIVGGVMKDDSNEPILDPETKQPITGIDEKYYKAIIGHNSDVKDRVRAEIKETYKALGKEIPKEGTAQWDLMGRHILGDELKRRSKSVFREAQDVNQSAYGQKMELYMNPENRAAMKGIANLGDDDGSGTKPKKVNTVQALGKAMNGDPEYLNAEKVTVNGREVVDITSTLPGGGLKHGRGEDDKYKSIYVDPKTKTLIVETELPAQYGIKKTEKKEIKEAEVGQFITKIATANGVPREDVRKYLDEMGYKGGKFTQAAAAEEKPAAKKESGGSIMDKVKGFFGYGNKPAEPKKATGKKPPSGKELSADEILKKYGIKND